MLGTKKEVKDWLVKSGIKHYTINEDLSVSVEGDVLLASVGLIGLLPVKFRDVNGHFNCSHNYLTSLDGCPSRVGGHFNCDGNELSLLKGCPEYVGGNCSFIANKLVESEEFLYNCDVEKIGNYYRSKNLNNKLTKSLVDVQEVVIIR